MNFGMNHEPVICRYNLRGMCRFGGRCRNIHDNPEKIAEKLVEKSIENNLPQQDASLGACALPPTSAPGKENINMNIYGPSTSSVEEAIQLVRISESKDKTCGICFEIILAKGTGPSKRFGILPNCNHCFCFTCIKTWRQCRDVDLEVSKACPECRIASDFVYPSKHWLDNKNEKTMFIDNQKQRMKNLDCKYYRKGKGTCPFGNKCLYRHALPNGKLIDVGPPRRLRRSEDGPTDLEHLVEQVLLLGPEMLESDSDDGFDLDLSDPLIAIQYYDKDDIEYYIAMDQLMNVQEELDISDDGDETDYDDCC